MAPLSPHEALQTLPTPIAGKITSLFQFATYPCDVAVYLLAPTTNGPNQAVGLMSKYAMTDRRCRCPSGSETRASEFRPPQLCVAPVAGLIDLTSFIRSSLFAIGPGSQNGPMKKSH